MTGLLRHYVPRNDEKGFLTTEGTENTEYMRNFCDIVVSNFIAVIVVLWVVFCVFYPSQIPTFTFTAITAGFAYQAYRYTKEKFRLELFEKRWEVYAKVLEFHQIFADNGGLSLKLNSSNEEEIKKAVMAAEQSFRGIGWHKSESLFGEDISLFFKSINDLYDRKINITFMEDAGTVLYGPEEERTQRGNDIQFVLDNINNLPELFAPYLYFGDYKYESNEKISVASVLSVVKKFQEKFQSFNSRKDEI